MILYQSQWDYLELNHKVTFDYFKKIIFVSPLVSSIDVKIDLYSDMKEWLNLPDRKNRQFKPPIRVIGGDATVAGQNAGDIYFMKEGWRVSYDPTKVSITGVLFSDDYDTPYLYSENLAQKIYPALVSSLVTGVDIDIESAPTAEENAAAIQPAIDIIPTAAENAAAIQPAIDIIPTASETAAAVNAIWAGMTPAELLTIKKFIGLK